jgi:hypothetical protein
MRCPLQRRGSRAGAGLSPPSAGQRRAQGRIGLQVARESIGVGNERKSTTARQAATGADRSGSARSTARNCRVIRLVTAVHRHFHQTQQRRSEEDGGEQGAETRRQPERLRLVVERALDLRGVVALRATIRSSGLREGGDVGGTVSEPDRDEEVGVADVESVDAVERRRQRDRPDRVRIRRRLDPTTRSRISGPTGTTFVISSTMCQPKPVRNGCEQAARAEAERNPFERGDVASALVPQLSAAELRVGEVGVALRQAGEVRTVSEANVEPADLALRPRAFGPTLARDQDLPDLASLREPLLCRIPVARIAVEDRQVAFSQLVNTRIGITPPGPDAEALAGARVEKHFARLDGIGDPAREQLRPVENLSQPSMFTRGTDGLRPDELTGGSARPGRSRRGSGGRGLDGRKGSDLLDRPLVVVLSGPELLI